MTNFKDDLACNIALVCVLALTGIYIILLSLNLFGATNFALYESFSYITAYILIVCCLAVYIVAMLLISRKKFVAPSWLRIMFYVAFFVFTNVYYFFGLFENMFWTCVMFAYFAFLAEVSALSIFYNSLKDEKNRLQVSNTFLLLCVTGIALAILFIVSLAVLVISKLALQSAILASPEKYITFMLVMLLSALFVAFSFAISLVKNKTWINACLVKVNLPAKVSRSAKQR